MNPLVSDDHRLWCEKDEYVKTRLSLFLTSEGFIVEKPNILLDPKSWDKSLNNKSIVLILFGNNISELAGSVYWSKSFIDDLEFIGNEYNNKFTLITDHILINPLLERHNIKIITPPEFFGVYYNKNFTPSIDQKYAKLYNLLLQRITLFRLELFAAISDNNLLEQGYNSCLGYQITHEKSSQEVINKLIHKNNTLNLGCNLDSMLNQNFPYKNFEEPSSLFDLERTTKYSIVFETYNDAKLYDIEWLLFTEKTMRSIQVNNISLLLNSSVNTSSILQDKLNLKVHPINHILDRMPDCLSQTEFIIGLMQHDILFPSAEELYNIAIHNISVIKNYHDQLYTDIFYQNIANQII